MLLAQTPTATKEVLIEMSLSEYGLLTEGLEGEVSSPSPSWHTVPYKAV